MSTQLKTPILLLTFNRPETTQRVFDAIRQIQPKQLFVVGDGARSGNTQDVERINSVRSIVSQVDWDCEVQTLFRPNNLGCKLAVSSAIDWFFEHVEQGIILEDDCLPNQDFFKFCEKLLVKHRNDSKVMMISGTNYLGDRLDVSEDYVFSRYFAIWGWATWKRAWEKYDIKMTQWEGAQKQKLLDKYYHQTYIKNHLSAIFDHVKRGKVDTWDIQWFYTCLVDGGLSIVPRVNLVTNIGTTGSHTSGNTDNNNRETYPLSTAKLLGLAKKKVNQLYDEAFFQEQFGQRTTSQIEAITLSTLSIYHRLRILMSGKVLVNVNRTNYRKKCLLIYLTSPFSVPSLRNGMAHQNMWQVVELARIIGEKGYDVDVVDYNQRPTLSSKYHLVVDLHPHDDPVYKDHLTKSAKKIAYITGSNPSFSNQKELERIAEIASKYRVRLTPRRQVKPISKGIEEFDGVIMFGNKTTKATFTKEFRLPSTYLIPNTYQHLVSDMTHKNKKMFMYLGGRGQVHKGLDLVLEAFSRVPEATVYICSYYEEEKDITKLFHKQLYETKNIIPVGGVRVGSLEFQELASKCGYSILPSCSEGCAGSVVTSIACGMIPIITDACGVDSPHSIKIETAVDSIQNAIKKAMSVNNINFQSSMRAVRNRAINQYSGASYKSSVAHALGDILSA